MKREKRQNLLLALCVLGFAIALLAGLAERLPWLASFCTFFSGSCKEVAKTSLFGLPLWGWGGIFYVLLTVAAFSAPSVVPWLAAAALGIDLILVKTMFSSHELCVFCLATFVVVLAICAAAFEKSRLWQMLSTVLLLLLLSTALLPYLKTAQGAARADGNKAPDIVASIGGRAITAEEIEKPLALRMHNLEMEIYREKRAALDGAIAQTLLAREAARRKITVEQLIDETAKARGVKVEDAEIQNYLQQNRSKLADWKGSEEELEARVKDSLFQQKMFQTIRDFAMSLAAPGEVAVYLKEPPMPFTPISPGNDPSLGPPNAPVTVIVFSDYQCPACRKAHATIEELRGFYKEKVRWVFKDYPLESHKGSDLAAVAARCAREQGKFSEYQDVLFSTDESLNYERLSFYAKQLGLDSDGFDACFQDPRFKAAVAKDREEARNAGIDQTPTIIVNGKFFSGPITVERFKEVIDREPREIARKQEGR